MFNMRKKNLTKHRLPLYGKQYLESNIVFFTVTWQRITQSVFDEIRHVILPRLQFTVT